MPGPSLFDVRDGPVRRPPAKIQFGYHDAGRLDLITILRKEQEPVDFRGLHLFSMPEVMSMARSSVLGAATRVEPGPSDRRSAMSLRQAVAGVTHLSVRLPDGVEIELPAALIKILQASADELSAGHAVTVLGSEVLLTPAEVGDLLGLSRPFVARLLDQGQIASEYLPDSRHRVVRLEDVLAFQARRERRREGRRRIVSEVESDDLPY